jgi:ELWxxDGT repeat protein
MFATDGAARGLVRSLLRACAASGAFAISLASLAATPQLVRNINDATIPHGSTPRNLATFNGKFLFVASGGATTSLWSSDGTTAGTTLVKSFGGTGVVAPSGQIDFLQLGARGYFVANDGVNGAELWSTDGTPAGTVLAMDLRAGDLGSQPGLRGVLGSRLIFTATDSAEKTQLYASDGTAAGTQALTAFSGPNSGLDAGFIILADKMYFAAHDNSFQRQLWVSDGTPGGTSSLTGPASFSNPRFFQRLGNSLLYVDDSLLWSIDLATDTIAAVRSPIPGVDPRLVTPAGPIVLNGFAMFIADGFAFGSLELWRTDGTAPGTVKVGDIHAGPAPFDARQNPLFLRVGDRVVYIADDGVNGPQLWGSDGATTVRLTNASKPPNVSHQIAVPIETIAGIAYFTLADGASATTWSVWRTDGTVAGTRKINGLPAVDQSVAAVVRAAGDGSNVFFRLAADPAGSLWKYQPGSEALTALHTSVRHFTGDLFHYDGTQLYFAHQDRVMGSEPWVSNGTAAGTRLLLDIRPQGTADNGSAPNEFVEFGGRLAFVADDGATGRELWISDGTAAGTTLLADINPGPGSSTPNHLIVANGALYFFASDALGVSTLMRMQSPTAEVEFLATAFASPFAGFSSCRQDRPVAMGGNVYFGAETSSSARRLWRSDGTAAGTGPVFTTPGEGIAPCELTVRGNRIFFSASGDGGLELWLSDGTAAGTRQVADLEPGLESSSPTALVDFNDALYFTTTDVDGIALLRKYDDSMGVALVAQIAPKPTPDSVIAARGVLNGKLLLELFDRIPPQPDLIMPRALWTSGGATADTARLATFQSDGMTDLIVSGGRAYFEAVAGSGIEPWMSDGTTAGTQLLRDLKSGDSNPAWFGDFNGVTLLAAEGEQGPTLWRTDGTSAGTVAISAIPAGPPTEFVTPPTILLQQRAVGQKFFFVASDAEIGDELYVLVNEAPLAAADSANSADSAPVTVNVLANDSDPDGSLVPQSVRVTANPTSGSVAANANGALVYTPAAGFSGTVTFSYTVNDNQGATSNAAVVSVSVTAPTTVTTTARRGGGGSTTVLTALALLALLTLRRRAA